MSQIISCQVDDLIKKRLDEISKLTEKNQSDIMRAGIERELNKMEKTISSSFKGTKETKKLGSLTALDSEVINEWKSTYNLGNVRVFAPPVKAVLNNLRKEGFTQDEILKLVRGCRKVPMVNKLEEATGRKAPPLSSILTAKMVPHLLFLLDEEEEVESDVSLEDYKRETLDEVWDEIPPLYQDKFRKEMMACASCEAVDILVGVWMEGVYGD